MRKGFKAALTTAALGVALAGTTAGVALAGVGPDLTPLIDTTCNYSQVIAGINALDPGLGDKIANFPPVAGKLQQFLAAPNDQRQAIATTELDDHPRLQEIVDAVEGDPGGQMDIGLLTQVSKSCSTYPAGTAASAGAPTPAPAPMPTPVAVPAPAA